MTRLQNTFPNIWLKKHNVTDPSEQHTTCLNALKQKMTKKDLAVMVAALPFTSTELMTILSLKNDLKNFIRTGVFNNLQLETVFDNVEKRCQ